PDQFEPWRVVVDERAIWDTMAGHQNAVTLDDHVAIGPAARGFRARELAEQGADVYVPPWDALADLPMPEGTGVLFDSGLIGLGSGMAGTDVHMLDGWGLADAFGSHTTRDPRARIGHQKGLPFEYRAALLPGT